MAWYAQPNIKGKMLAFIIEDQDVLWIVGDPEDLLWFAKKLDTFLTSDQTIIEVDAMGSTEPIFEEHKNKDLIEMDKIVFHLDSSLDPSSAHYICDKKSRTVNFYGPNTAIQSLQKGLEGVALSNDPLEHDHVYDYLGGAPRSEGIISLITIYKNIH